MLMLPINACVTLDKIVNLRFLRGKKWVCIVFFLINTLPVTAVQGETEKVFLPDTKIIMPSGQVVLVTEGKGEPRSIGSYSIHLYAGNTQEYPFDDFLAGIVRARDGAVEKILTREGHRTGGQELIVIMRSAGTGSYLSADAFAVLGNAIHLLATVSGLDPESDPVVHLDQMMNGGSGKKEGVPATSCSVRKTVKKNFLPRKGEVLTIQQVRDICMQNGLEELWGKIEKDPPARPFQSDGCSLWFETWRGASLYPACFMHDLKYWAGYPGEDVARLIADADLMIDVACILDSAGMAETMFQGVRRGGHEMYQQAFSWGFGRFPEEIK